MCPEIELLRGLLAIHQFEARGPVSGIDKSMISTKKPEREAACKPGDRFGIGQPPRSRHK